MRLTQVEMNRARLARDASCDGLFWVGVRTMKVFCLPSCPAKQPLAKNVLYFHSRQEAVKKGYRPCKRCRPERVIGLDGDAIQYDLENAPRHGNGECLFTQTIASPIGDLTIGATAKGVCLVEFSDCRCLPTEIATLQRRLVCKAVAGNNGHLDRIKDELREYFAGRLKRFTTPLEMPGTPFERSVWKKLLEIPYGKTASYSQIAVEVGHPSAQRAVGRANGENKIAIVVPCHRVIQAGGTLGGYGGGLWRKQYLLDLERTFAAR